LAVAGTTKSVDGNVDYYCYYYYYYQQKWLRWCKIKRLQGHLTVSDSVTVQTSVVPQ